MIDKFDSYQTSLESPATKAFVVAPNDDTELAIATRNIYVGVAGDLKAILVGDTEAVVFKSLPVGVHPLRIKKVLATGTAATNLIGLL